MQEIECFLVVQCVATLEWWYTLVATATVGSKSHYRMKMISRHVTKRINVSFVHRSFTSGRRRDADLRWLTSHFKHLAIDMDSNHVLSAGNSHSWRLHCVIYAGGRSLGGVGVLSSVVCSTMTMNDSIGAKTESQRAASLSWHFCSASESANFVSLKARYKS